MIKLGIIEKPTANVDCIILNINVLTTLLMSTDKELLENVEKLAKLKTKKSSTTKAEAIRQNLKTNIQTTNVELLCAYSEWIDAVYAKQGWMSKQAVVSGQTAVDDFSNRNLDVAIAVINIAAIHGYVDMQWAINKYNEQYRVKRNMTYTPPPISTSPVELSSEAF